MKIPPVNSVTSCFQSKVPRFLPACSVSTLKDGGCRFCDGVGESLGVVLDNSSVSIYIELLVDVEKSTELKNLASPQPVSGSE